MLESRCHRVGRRWGAVLVLLTIVASVACTGRFLPPAPSAPQSPAPAADDQMIIVTVAPGDSVAGLAQTHLGDAAQAWRIGKYNGPTALTPGDRIVIPRRPIGLGGLHHSGYQSVPILVYEGWAGDKSERALSAADFAAHMAYLAHNGYSVVGVEALLAFMRLEDELPAAAVMITLDGTGAWVYTTAYPILRRYGFAAALFIVPDDVGRPGNLNWGQLRRMAADGIAIGLLETFASFTPSAESSAAPSERLQRMVRRINKGGVLLESHLGRKTELAAYTGGPVDDFTAMALKQRGFRAAFGRGKGLNPFFADPLALNRQVVGVGVEAEQLKKMLITFCVLELR